MIRGLSALDRKLVRDFLLAKGQIIAIGMVIACGVATFLMSQTALESLKTTKAMYFDRHRFAQIFLRVKRAPNATVTQIAQIPGVNQIQARVVRDVTLDVPGLLEPAVGRLISMPDPGRTGLNDLYLRRGRFVEPGRDAEVVVSEGFADAHRYQPGDRVTAIINGRKKQLEIVGVVLSPEYIYQIRAGQLVPDDKRFGVFWMGRQALASAFDMEGAFNDLCLSLVPGASEQEVIARLDELMDRYGGLGAFGREDQVSNRFVSDEIKQLGRMGLIIPSIFLGVAAFLLNVVLSRIISLQRDQIAALKAFGYSHAAVGWHYLKLVLLVAFFGTLLGIGTGSYLGLQMLGMYTRFYRFPELQFLLPPRILLLSFAVSGGAAMLGTLSVVRKAVSLPPAEAMRPEPPALYRPTLLERLGLTRYFSQPMRMILRQIERRPLKSFLSAFGMALAVAILILGRFTADAIDFMLDVQFELVQRQDLSVAFIEPRSLRALHEIKHLPGVLHAEPFRSVPVRLKFAYRERRVAILGYEVREGLNHLVDRQLRPVKLPEEGVLLNTKLAQLLGVGLGDTVSVEVLEGGRPKRQVRVTGLANEFIGTAAYMNLDALNRLLKEGNSISGALVMTDERHFEQLYQTLKETPQVASVTVKAATVRSFRDTVVENLTKMQTFNLMFAAIIAFGVVYNTARIALSERGRELASLRVIGFTRGEISFILLGELGLLTLAAIPIGLGAGYGLVRVTTLFLDTELYRIPLIIDLRTYAFSVTLVIVASVISGLAVRRRLDELDLIAVLKTRE